MYVKVKGFSRMGPSGTYGLCRVAWTGDTCPHKGVRTLQSTTSHTILSQEDALRREKKKCEKVWVQGKAIAKIDIAIDFRLLGEYSILKLLTVIES